MAGIVEDDKALQTESKLPALLMWMAHLCKRQNYKNAFTAFHLFPLKLEKNHHWCVSVGFSKKIDFRQQQHA